MGTAESLRSVRLAGVLGGVFLISNLRCLGGLVVERLNILIFVSNVSIGFANTFALGRGQRGLRGGSRGMESVAWLGSHACPWRVGKRSIADRQTDMKIQLSVQCCNFRPKVWQLVEVCPQSMESFLLAPR